MPDRRLSPSFNDRTGKYISEDMVPDEVQKSPDALLLINSLREELEAALRILNNTEREVVKQHFGLSDVGDSDACAKKLGLKPGQLHQIKKKALRKLRRSATQSLQLYVD